MLRLICFSMIMFILSVFSVSATYSEEYFTVQMSENHCVIISCDKNLSGELIIPSEIDGKAVVCIGEKAFYNCTELTRIVIPDTVTDIDEKAFAGCSNLQELEMPDSVLSLGQNIFSGCFNLEKVRLSDNIQFVSQKCFYDCKKLNSVNFPLKTRVIEPKAFMGCKALESVVLSDNTESIADNAFENCSSLRTVYLPERVEYIGVDAFGGCSSLENVYYQGASEVFSKIEADAGNELLLSAYIQYGHIHSDDKVNILKEAGCTFPGYVSYECRCTYLSSAEEMPATGHSLSVPVTVSESDCTKSGIAHSYCKNCEYYEVSFIPAKGHSAVVDKAVKSTCAKAGKTEGSHCSACGQVITPQITVPKKAHDFTVMIKDKKHLASKATYKNPAKYYYTCSLCGAVSSDKLFEGEKLSLSVPDKVGFTSTDYTVTLSWKSVPSVRGYAVYTVDSKGVQKLYKRVRDNSVKICGLTMGKVYRYVVRTYVIEDKKIMYSQKSVTVTAATKPAPPDSIAAKASNTSVKLSWNRDEDVTGFRIYRYDTKKCKWVTVRSYITSASVSLKGLEGGRQYKYAVRSCIDTGKKLVFSKKYKSVTVCTKPESPTVKAIAYKYSASFEWNEIKHADRYAVYVSSEPNGNYRRIAITKDTSYKATGLDRKKTYYFKIFAYRMLWDKNVYSYPCMKIVKTK